MKKEKIGFDRKVTTFADAICDVYRIEQERGDYPKFDLCEDDLTEDFTAMLWAQMLLYKRVTGEKDMDIPGFIGILNRLAVQRLMNGGQVVDELGTGTTMKKKEMEKKLRVFFVSKLKEYQGKPKGDPDRNRIWWELGGIHSAAFCIGFYELANEFGGMLSFPRRERMLP